MTFQAIIFKKDNFTKAKADSWLRRHKYVLIKPFHETINYFRARLKEPNAKKYEYRIIDIANGIKAVAEYVKK